MTDSFEQHEREVASWWWVLALVGLAFVGLVIWAVTNDDPASKPLPVANVEPEPSAPLPVARIAGNSVLFMGGPVWGTVQVAEVPTARTFWVEEGGERLLVVIHPPDREQPLTVRPGDVLRLTNATVHDPANVANLSSELDAETRRIVQAQRMVLVVDADDVMGVVGPGPDAAAADTIAGMEADTAAAPL